MAKIKLKISDMFCRFRIKTAANSLTGLKGVQRAKVNRHASENISSFNTLGVTSAVLTKTMMEISLGTVWKTAPLSLRLIGGILIILLSITGCADVPYTGPILKVSDVEQFLNSRDEDAACIDDGFDSVCIKLIADEAAGDPVSDDSGAPVIHVHPTSLSYLFYYEDKPILLAERTMDTTQIVQELIDAGKIQGPPDGSVWNDNNDNIPNVWVVQVYYPDAFRQVNRRLRSRDIRVVEGTRIRRDSRRDLEIENFTRDGSRGVQFSIETEVSQIAIQVEGLVPDHIAEFYIDADGVESDTSASTLELRPL